MSITGHTDYKKPSHRRKDSDELDVFEAARYFSGYNDNFALVGGANMAPKMVMREERDGYLRGGRISLDIPSLRHHHYYHQNHQQNHPIAQPHHHHNHHQQQKIKEIKKHKQPSSPGGKLAHFLNSLFSQTSSKKKKTSKSSTQSMKDEDESPSGRRKRRSSISHFRSTSSVSDAKSIYSCSSYSDHKDVNVLATLSKYIINPNDGSGNPKKDENIRGSNLDWVDDKIKFKSGFVEKPKKSSNHGYQDKNRGINKFSDELDDGAESDSSSDLFELQIDYGLGFCSSGLPVYETTHIDSIKRSSASPITNGPLKN